VGGGVHIGFTRHVAHWMASCTCPGWLWWLRRIWWNEDWQGKLKYSEKTCPSATLSTTNPTCQTRAAMVGSQWLIAWGMAWPKRSSYRLLILKYFNIFTFILLSENAAHHGECARWSQAVSNEQVIYKRTASPETNIFPIILTHLSSLQQQEIVVLQ
jgi:hypothetical protein